MQLDPHDTIVALSSAAGPGGRAIVRLSGTRALDIAGRLFTSTEPISPERRRCYAGQVELPGVAAPLSTDLYVWPAPRTYTGQNLVELHTLSCPPLVDLLVAKCLDAGARAAQPGEFTLRAFLAGKLDLPRAEAVLGVIEAGSREQLTDALAQLAGGVSQPLQDIRSDLLDLLAEVEAGLDFAEEDIRFVEQTELLKRISRALAYLTILQKQLDQRALSGRAFRVVLAGRPNAGKSSLFNALVGTGAAIVSPEPGTTRDYLVQRLELGDVSVELIDTAGWRHPEETCPPSVNEPQTPPSPSMGDGRGGGDARGQTSPPTLTLPHKGGGDDIEKQAQTLGRAQAAHADLVLLCLEANQALNAEEESLLRHDRPPLLAVSTKCDLASGWPELPATSAITGAGISELRELLRQRASALTASPLAPSLSRCRHHVQSCLEHLRQAHAVVLYEEPPELLALELRGALDQLGEMVGAVYTDDLLDRIFSRFCIGK